MYLVCQFAGWRLIDSPPVNAVSSITKETLPVTPRNSVIREVTTPLKSADTGQANILITKEALTAWRLRFSEYPLQQLIDLRRTVWHFLMKYL